jgi:hypothetical protein
MTLGVCGVQQTSRQSSTSMRAVRRRLRGKYRHTTDGEEKTTQSTHLGVLCPSLPRATLPNSLRRTHTVSTVTFSAFSPSLLSLKPWTSIVSSLLHIFLPMIRSAFSSLPKETRVSSENFFVLLKSIFLAQVILHA